MNGRISLKKGKSEGSKDLRKILFKNNIYSYKNIPELKTICNSNRTKTNNLRIIKKNIAKRRKEILNTYNHKSPYSIYLTEGLSSSGFQKSLTNLYSQNNQINTGIKNSFNNPFFIPRDKEGLIVELYQLTNDMDVQNKELENLKKDYSNLIKNSLAYKQIMEKILELDEKGYYINSNRPNYILKNRKKSKSQNNFRNIKSINENEEYIPMKTINIKSKKLKNYKINDTSYMSAIKNDKNKYILKNLNPNDICNTSTINVLARQKTDLNKVLIEKERKLIKIKKDEKNQIFDEYISLLNEKNNQLETLVDYSKKLQFKQYETDSQINIYLTKVKKITDEIYLTNDKLNINKKDLENLQRDIESSLKYKEELKQKGMKLYEDEKQNQNNFKKRQKKENEIDNTLKEKQKYFEEQQKLDMHIKDLQRQEDNLKKCIDKKNLQIKGIKRDNNDLTNQILYYEERRPKLLEKADQPRKNKIRMKEIENEIKNLEIEIINYKVESDEKEKNMEETKEENKEKIVNLEEEINNHVDIAKDLDIQINKLKDEFKIIDENNSKVGEELSKIEGEYKNVQEQSRQEKETKEKIKKEKEIQRIKQEEMNNKQNEEKYNEYIKNKEEMSDEADKLKFLNNKIIEENKKLKDLQSKKMELYRLTIDKHAQLEKLLNEIKELSDKKLQNIENETE